MSAADREPKRLCIVTPSHSAIHPGGAEYQIDCLIELLASLKRYQIYYLGALVPDQVDTDAYRIVRIGRRSSAPRFGYLTQALPLYRALRSIQPHTIYQRVAGGYTAISSWYAARHRARLVFHVAHDSDVTPAQSLEGRNPVRRLLEKRSVEYGIRHADAIVAQTAQQAGLLERHYGRRPQAIIGNFQPPARETIDKSGPLTVVWIAGLTRWKRPEAFRALAATLRDLTEVRFVMIGPPPAGTGGDREWGEALLQRIRATPNLQYLGARSQAEVNQILARAHLFVNTSQYEGFPNTFIQAWMRGAVVVSLNVDPDGVLDGQSMGRYCAGSEQQLAESVRTLITDPALRGRYAERAREFAISKHSLANAHALARLLDPDGSEQ